MSEGHDVVRRHRGLFGRTALVSGLTLVSRLLGFARESLSAVLFGDASTIYDGFVTAWRVPNLFRRLLGEGALATSLQNAMTEADHDSGNEAGRRVFRSTMRWALAILVVTCVLLIGGISVLPDSMPVTGWHWLGDDPEPVRELCMRLMPFVVLICLAALASGALQVRGHYLSTVLAPVAMNLVWIAALVGIGMVFGWAVPTALGADAAGQRTRQFDMARVLTWGVLAAGLVSFVVLVPALLSNELLGREARTGERSEPSGGAGPVLLGALPLAFGAAVYQVNVMIDGLMAEALLAAGGPTTLYLANRIQQLPMGLIAIAALSAVFPALKALGHTRQFGQLRGLHDRTHLAILFFALPATAGLFVLAQPIVAVLLQHGAFSAEGVARTSLALKVLALSLVPAGAASLVSRTFFALGDVRTPVQVSVFMLVLNIGLNVAFVVGLGMDVEGLALATVVTSWLNLAVLLPLLLRRLPSSSAPLHVGARLIKILVASLATGLAASGAHQLVDPDPRSPASLVAAIAAGALTFALFSRVLGLPEWERFSRRS